MNDNGRFFLTKYIVHWLIDWFQIKMFQKLNLKIITYVVSGHNFCLIIPAAIRTAMLIFQCVLFLNFLILWTFFLSCTKVRCWMKLLAGHFQVWVGSSCITCVTDLHHLHLKHLTLHWSIYASIYTKQVGHLLFFPDTLADDDLIPLRHPWTPSCGDLT